MPLDFNALMQDPQFQMGLGFLGLASPKNRPMLDAYNMLQQMEQRKQEAAKQRQEMEYRKAQIEHYGSQVAEQRRANDLHKDALEASRRMYENIFGDSQPTAQPATQTSVPTAQPALPAVPNSVQSTPVAPQNQPVPHPLPQMQLDKWKITPSSQNDLDSSRQELLTAELADATQRMAAGDPRASLDIAALQKEIQSLPQSAKTNLGTISGSPETQVVQVAQTQKEREKQEQIRQRNQVLQKALALQATGGLLDYKNPGAGLASVGKSMLEIEKMHRQQQQDDLLEQNRQSDIGLRAQKLKVDQDELAIKQAAEKRQQEKQDKEIRAKEEEKARGKATVDSLLDSISSSYDKLSKGAGITDPTKSTLENIRAGTASSGVGQFFGKMGGTENQSARNNIIMARPLMVQAIVQATGMSAKQVDSENEAKRYLDAATDPALDIRANKLAIERLRTLYGSPKKIGDSASKESVEQAWGAYEPDKYEYRIGPNGRVQRKLK